MRLWSPPTKARRARGGAPASPTGDAPGRADQITETTQVLDQFSETAKRQQRRVDQIVLDTRVDWSSSSETNPAAAGQLT
jgi:hypothetical protein